jgi:cytochrome c oxidase subunit IV
MSDPDRHAVSAMAHHPVNVRGYLAVFGALLVLTLVTVAVSYLDLPVRPTILVALAIAVTKASLVAMFFMHLKGERPMVYWPLGLTAFLAVALFASLLWSEADHLFGTRFHDAFSAGGAPAAHGADGGGH